MSPRINLQFAFCISQFAIAAVWPALPAAAQTNFAAYPKLVQAARRSRQPADRALVKQLAAATPKALAAEKQAARKQRLPLTTAQLTFPTPPLDQNAGPDWVKLTHTFTQKPLERRIEEYSGRVGSTRPLTAEETDALRQALQARAEEMELIRIAADKPQCVFTRERGEGAMLPFPELATMRRAARLLRAEALLTAQSGRHLDAVAGLKRGFRIADHAAADPSLAAFSAAVGIDAITLAGCETILQEVGPNNTIGNAVRDAISQGRPGLSLRRALEGEAVSLGATIAQWRKTGPAGPAALEKALSGRGEDVLALTDIRPSRLSAADRKAWNSLLDAVYVDQLRRIRVLHAAAGKPFPARDRWYRSFAPSAKDRLQPFRELLLPDLERVDEAGARVKASEECLLAGAAILSFRAEKGMFPDLLNAVYPQIPKDAYSGKLLRYRQEPNGFVVFSAGPDGTFTGGKPGQRVLRQALFRFPAATTRR